MLEDAAGRTLGNRPEELLNEDGAVTIRPGTPRAWRNDSRAAARVLIVTLRASR